LAIPCPFHITDEEQKTWWAEAQEWQDRQDELHEIYNAVGVDEGGWVPMEDFEAACDRYKNVKKEWIERGCLEGDWPFGEFVLDGQSWFDSLKQRMRGWTS